MRLKLLLCVLLIPYFCGCAAYKPAPEIVKAVELIQSASQDIADHNIPLSRQRLGEYIAELTIEKVKPEPDKNKIRELQEKIALEEENISSLKELPLALQDLSEWSKGE